jgi:hypothetical protein
MGCRQQGFSQQNRIPSARTERSHGFGDQTTPNMTQYLMYNVITPAIKGGKGVKGR